MAPVEAPSVSIREATLADHPALMALEGSAFDTGATLIQARRNFFARMDAYPQSRVLVAELNERVIGVLCVSLTTVRVGGDPCRAGYLCNARVESTLQARGLGPVLMRTATRWLEEQGASYVTGLIKTSNTPSMKMVSALGWETLGRFDYLVLDLERFDPDPEARVRKVNILEDAAWATWRLGSVSLQHFVPFFLHTELFLPYPSGSYMGSLTASCPDGSAWLSLWDDRVQRGLDPETMRAVKGYDVTVKGRAGIRAFSAIAVALRRAGLRQLLMPLPHDIQVREALSRYAEDVVEFNFVGRPLNGAGPVPPGPIYFDIRH
ncbi:MAG TPA: GNAT family N-acetyltransferase [Methylomirabilota bacterium]|nr:GNAT family N-acetyltransferase [Methylomirabilota bacterium]